MTTRSRWKKVVAGDVPLEHAIGVLRRKLHYRIRPTREYWSRKFPAFVAASTSQTDRPDYKQFCRKAATSDHVFMSFKKHPWYTVVLEHVSYEQGQQYLDSIKNLAPDIYQNLVRYAINDTIGQPRTYSYEVGDVSPTTLRYIKIACEIRSLFGDLRELAVTEIGPAYGGQCVSLHALGGFGSYVGIDLPESLMLMRRYVDALAVPKVELRSQAGASRTALHCDLLISNYAFSECSKASQDYYLEHVISAAPRGYMIYNSANNPDDAPAWCPYNKRQIVDRLSALHDIQLLPEEPQTGSKSDNFLIIWDDTK